MSGILSKREWASLMLTRVSKEASRALPRQAYMDPAASALFPAERQARAEARERKKVWKPK